MTTQTTTLWTPAPWRQQQNNYEDGIIIVSPQGGSMAVVYHADLLGNTLPVKANARLIAAAPEMAETLERMAAVFAKWSTSDDGALAEARALLTRIRGETL